MKTFVFVLSLGMLLATGCATSDQAALEKRVAELEKRNEDLLFKGTIVTSHLTGSPLQDFFNSPEFWENTYDSGQADCAKRCVTTLTAERQACANIADCVQRQQCFEAASQRASNCQTQCSQNNPPPIP